MSRVFAPQAGIPEDPVTGSAHAVLAPYWADRLARTSLVGTWRGLARLAAGSPGLTEMYFVDAPPSEPVAGELPKVAERDSRRSRGQAPVAAAAEASLQARVWFPAASSGIPATSL